MGIHLDAKEARKADNTGAIRESGRYTGIITRAEKLTAATGTEGLGLSFKSDDESTANYLNIYLSSQIHAILVCTKTKNAEDGEITFDAYDKEAKATYKKTVPGYPSLMGKRIGILLQRELSVYLGKQQDRVAIFGIFEADTGLSASEILDKKTEPKQIQKMYESLMAKPIKDTRDAAQKSDTNAQTALNSTGSFDDFEDDIPF